MQLGAQLRKYNFEKYFKKTNCTNLAAIGFFPKIEPVGLRGLGARRVQKLLRCAKIVKKSVDGLM